MKCLVLTGGPGERLWPLSRKNCPKQFIEIENNHSIFQDTIARNIPYCDEFIIISNVSYQFIIENQLEPFQGLNYRCIYEEEGKKTTAAITLACMSLQSSEYVLVTNTNLLISAPEYKDAILKAKENAANGRISILVSPETKTDSRYGYVLEQDQEHVKKYVEKPQSLITGEVYKNLGFLIFQNGIFLKELQILHTELWNENKRAFQSRVIKGGNTYYRKDMQVTQISIEKSLLEESNRIYAIQVHFAYRDIRTLDDLTGYNNKGVVVNHTDTSRVINTSKDKAIVVNDVEDLVVVNTDDALYVGKDGIGLKEILQTSELKEFVDKSNLFHRSWGKYEELVVEREYRLRRLIINPGKTIYEHKHEKRMESWTVLKGTGKFSLNGVERICCSGETITAQISVKHQISNVGANVLILVETTIGEFSYDDMRSTTSKNTNEYELGLKNDPMIRLKPALKDYIWGGNTLKNKYGIESDLDVLAEAWELSAHPDGESIVDSGRHKGLTFSKYIEVVGKNILGWKCSPLQSFPMLVKFIDAKENLSIQVHPDDDYALEKENQYGKNEMWYIIDSKPGCGLYVGFSRDVTREEVKYAVERGTITDLLNFYPTKPGDIFFIPAGTVHAICGGNLICEIQQSSNCTYRLYDYGRRDKFGNTRELHVKKALDVISLKKYEAVQGNVSCKYFETEIRDISGEERLRISDERFLSLICLEGSGDFSIEDYKMIVKAGDSIFVPAQNTMLHMNGKMKLAISHI